MSNNSGVNNNEGTSAMATDITNHNKLNITIDIPKMHGMQGPNWKGTTIKDFWQRAFSTTDNSIEIIPINNEMQKTNNPEEVPETEEELEKIFGNIKDSRGK